MSFHKPTRFLSGDPARLAVIILICVQTAGCKREENDAPAPAARAPRVAPKPRPQTVVPEPEAFHILLTLDSSRIASANALRELSQSEAVLEFARVVTADHRAVWRMLFGLTRETGTAPTDNVASQTVRQGTEQFVTELMARDSGINNSYLTHEVREHEQTLMLLDTTLIPSARDTALRTMLLQIRPMLEAHVQQARRIQAAREEAARRAAAGAPVVGAPLPGGAPQPVGAPIGGRPARPDSSRAIAKPARPDSTPKLLGTPITSTTNM
jgi:putative membrane protein